MDKKETDHIDIRLVDRFKEGDITAFKQLVEKYKDVSLSLICSVLKDRDRSEDVLQDVFIKVYHKIDSFKHKSSFATWLYRITINTSLNALKKQKTHLDISEMQAVIFEPENPSAFDQLNQEDQKKYIQKALDLLKPDEALILRLFYLCELKISEIEEVTGYKVSKIKVDLHRGRKNMQNALHQLLGNESQHLL